MGSVVGLLSAFNQFVLWDRMINLLVLCHWNVNLWGAYGITWTQKITAEGSDGVWDELRIATSGHVLQFQAQTRDLTTKQVRTKFLSSPTPPQAVISSLKRLTRLDFSVCSIWPQRQLIPFWIHLSVSLRILEVVAVCKVSLLGACSLSEGSNSLGVHSVFYLKLFCRWMNSTL